MRHLWPMAAVVLLLCTIAAAHAAPSFLGDTGLILTPNALTADRHTALPHWHSMSGTIGESDGNASGNWDAAGVLLGLTDRLELYLGYFSFDDAPFAGAYVTQRNGSSYFWAVDQFVAHIKAQALREPDDWLNLAIGVRNMGMDTRDHGDYDPTPYAVATKTITGSEEGGDALRLSFGMQFANEDDWFNEQYWPEDKNGNDQERESLFGSAEWMVNRHIRLLAELQEAGENDSVFNFGARFNPCDSVAVDAFFIDDEAVSDYDMAVGISGLIPFDADNVFADEDRTESHDSTAPSHFGDTGLILMPNALVAPRHTVTPTYHNINNAIGEYSGNSLGSWESAGVLVGTTPRLEIFAGLLAYDDDPFDDEDVEHQDDFVFHAKAQALREPDDWCNVAVGVRNIGLSDVGDWGENEPSAYIAATKTICASDDEDDPSFFRATAGLLVANQDGFLNQEYFPENRDYDDYDDSSLFLGGEYRPCRWVTFLGEVIEAGDDDHAFNFGVRLHPIENLVVDGYFVDDVAQSDHELGFGASYQLEY